MSDVTPEDGDAVHDTDATERRSLGAEVRNWLGRAA